MRFRILRRRFIDLLFLAASTLCALTTASLLIGTLGFLLLKGGSALDLTLLTHLPRPVGEPGGGIANAIVGSAKLVALATVLATPPALAGAIFVAEYSHTAVAKLAEEAAHLLNSVPSIVVGLFIYEVCVVPFRHFSTWAGSAALAVLLLPAIVPSAAAALRLLPAALREGALALGASRWQSFTGVLLPAVAPAWLTAVLLGVARIAGETAPLLFTAFNNAYWSPGWNQPTASLPVTIYTYAISPYASWHRQAWAAAALLIGLVLVVNLSTQALLSLWRKGHADGRH